MEHQRHQLEAVGSWAGFGVGDHEWARLCGYAEWLAAEAIPAGGLGPAEILVLWERHILDSAMFGVGLPPYGTVADVGSGVGLPGLPLAIVRSDLRWVLVERSGRRATLLRRAVRVLGLGSAVDVLETDARNVAGFEGVVMRAVLPPSRLAALVDSALVSGGRAVVGAGLEPESLDGWQLVRFPGSEVLAPGRWLRMMQKP